VHHENFWDVRVGIPVRRTGKIEFGFDVGRNKDNYYQTNQFTTEDILDKTYNDFYCPSVTIEFNNLNRNQYANMGERFITQFRFISALEEHVPGTTSIEKTRAEQWHNFPVASVAYEKFFRKRGFYTSGFLVEAMLSFQDFYRNYTSTLLAFPAFTPLPEMTTIFQPSYRNPVYAAAGQRNVFSFGKNLDMRLEGFVMAPYREIVQDQYHKAMYGPTFNSLHYVVSASFVYQSPIGPLSASYAYYEHEEKPFSFFLNLGYILYNRESLH
jgi:NTE family protein